METNTRSIDGRKALAEAQVEAQECVIRDRIALIESIAYLKYIHARDDYDRSVREILAKAGSEGTPLALLRSTHPDAKQLDTVLDKLKEDNAVSEEKIGKTIILRAA